MWKRKKYGCGFGFGPNISAFCRSNPGMPRGWRCMGFNANIVPLNDPLVNIAPNQKDLEMIDLQNQLEFLESTSGND